MIPIPTVYKGYKFRSRLEARWAVLFDSLEIPYLYEPEGFQFDDGTRYLPDFYLPDSKQYFEVKGVMTDSDMKKIQHLIDEKVSVAIGYGDFSFQCCDDWWGEGYELCIKSSSALCRCRECGKYYFMGIDGVFTCPCCDAYDGDKHFDIIVMGNHTEEPYFVDSCFDEAVEKAKQIRFEYENFRRERLAWS